MGLKTGAWSAFIRLVGNEAMQLLAGRLDHLQEIRCVCRFWSMAPPKAGGKGAGCQDGAGEMLAQLLTEPVSQSDLGMWQSFHQRRHFSKGSLPMWESKRGPHHVLRKVLRERSGGPYFWKATPTGSAIAGPTAL